MIQSISAEGVWFWETDSSDDVWIKDRFWNILGTILVTIKIGGMLSTRRISKRF